MVPQFTLRTLLISVAIVAGYCALLARWPLLFALHAIPLSTEQQLQALLTIAGGEKVVLP